MQSRIHGNVPFNLTVLAEMNFGHTSPQMVLPLGCRAKVYASAQWLHLPEGAVTA